MAMLRINRFRMCVGTLVRSVTRWGSWVRLVVLRGLLKLCVG